MGRHCKRDWGNHQQVKGKKVGHKINAGDVTRESCSHRQDNSGKVIRKDIDRK